VPADAAFSGGGRKRSPLGGGARGVPAERSRGTGPAWQRQGVSEGFGEAVVDRGADGGGAGELGEGVADCE
jgi:hypothetical protein